MRTFYLIVLVSYDLAHVVLLQREHVCLIGCVTKIFKTAISKLFAKHF